LLSFLQAHKRGLDVEKLHDSATPAWRNLRGRTRDRKKQSYFEGPEDEEDELQDHPSEEEERLEEEEDAAGSTEASVLRCRPQVITSKS
jgi:hypothetical protein